MSSDLGIVTVTRTLRQILETGIPAKLGLGTDVVQGFHVTTFPPHRVRDQNKTDNLVNLFLYRTEVNAAWRNMPLPTSSKPSDNAQPPLALNLEYLISAYGEGDREDFAHYYLGAAMRVLHDCMIVPRASLAVEAEGKGLVHLQLENLRVAPRPLSVEEMSKLWATFQTHYRISAAYLVTVLLIDSHTKSKSGPPVLKRGPDDRGPVAIATPPPSLTRAVPDSGFAAVRFGEKLILEGENLTGGTVEAFVRHPLIPDETPLKPAVTIDSAEQATVSIPAATAGSKVAANWPAGIYTISLVITKPDQPKWTTNEVPFALAPAITIAPTTTQSPAKPPDTKFELTIDAIPQVRTAQRVFVLWDDAQFTPKPIAAPADDDAPSIIKVDVKGKEGFHRVRLRVDGVDSIPIVKINDLFEFDPNQSVQVKP